MEIPKLYIRKKLNRIYLAISILILSITTGWLFYMWVEDFTAIDAFYMAIITLSTVGYGEVEGLSQEGRLFTSFYIIGNMIFLAFGLSILAGAFFEGEIKNIFRAYITNREVKKMKGHVILCGYGRNGAKACEEFIKSNQEFVIIEKDTSVLETIPKEKPYNVILADATLDESLNLAAISKAKAIITTLPSDADNVFISLTAKELNPKIEVVARANEERSERKLRRAGASKVVKPDALGGVHMAQLITKPVVIEFLDLLNGLSSTDLILEEFSSKEFKLLYRNKTLRELDIRKKTNAMVIGFKNSNKGFVFTPSSNTKINEESVLILLGKSSDINRFKELYGS